MIRMNIYSLCCKPTDSEFTLQLNTVQIKFLDHIRRNQLIVCKGLGVRNYSLLQEFVFTIKETSCGNHFIHWGQRWMLNRLDRSPTVITEPMDQFIV